MLIPIPRELFRNLEQHGSGLVSMKDTAVRLDDKKAGGHVTPVTPAPGARRGDSRIPGGPKGVPTALDKLFLVGSGQYKSANEIPKQLEPDTIYRARSWGRIRINIGFLFVAALGGGLMVYLGKRDVARGESLESQNLEWHRKIKEDYERSKK